MNPILLTLSWLASMFYVGGYKPFPLWLALSLLLASALVIARSKQQTVWRVSSLDFITTALLVATLLACALSILPGTSLDPGLSIAGLPITYWATRHALYRGVSWRELSTPLHFAGALVVGIALLEFLVMATRPFASFRDANALAALFNALFFPLYLAVLADWQAGRTLASQKPQLLALAFLLAAIAVSTSMAAQLCLLGGLGLSILLVGIRSSKSWRGLALVMAVFIPAYLLTGLYTNDGRSAANRMATLSEQNSFTERLDMAESALEMYADGPWYGVGIGMYKVLYPTYRQQSERSTTGDLAHNDYVQFLAEGGPLLLASLLGVLGMVCWRLGQMWRRQPSNAETERQTLKTAGLAVAVLCVLLHAVMNFILYVLPLSMVLGLYLARIAATGGGRNSPRMEAQLDSRMATIIPLFAIGFLAFTLGLRSLFIGLTTDACQLRACEVLRNTGTKPLVLANFMAATQPTWMPPRDYIIARLRQEAAATKDPEIKSRALMGAALEVARVIVDAPAASYAYIQLASLLEETPSLASSLPPTIPAKPGTLYRLALDRDPQNQLVRLALARTMEAEGKRREAFDLVNDDGMRWWHTVLVPHDQRVAMLRFMIPRAIEFGLCAEVVSMSESLASFVPDSLLAKETRALLIAEPEPVPGCGLSKPLPEN